MDRTREKAEVMLAFARGERIQFRAPGEAWCGWELPHGPAWNWGAVEYRVEPKEVVIRVETWNPGAGFLEVRPYCREPHGAYVVLNAEGVVSMVLGEDLVRAVRRCSGWEAEKEKREETGD